MTKAPPFTDRMPEVLEDLQSVAAAILEADGSVQAANAGFRGLLEQAGVEDAGALFLQPTLAELANDAGPEAWSRVHEGKIALAGPEGQGDVSLTGTVHRKGDRLVVLAEHDPDSGRDLEEELRRSNELLQEFAYVVSHDLQEPLRMVRSYLQLIERRYEDKLDEEGEEFIDFAVDGADRMSGMIDALLEYSRVQSRGQAPSRVDVDEVVEGVLDSLRLRIEETGAKVDVGDLGEVQAGANQVRQLFDHLLENALTHGGDSPRIEVGAEPADDGFVRFWVADEGPGVPENEQEDVFGILKRGAEAPEEGPGIGLAICQRIVRRHGGEIGLESEPGEGARFWFTLPGLESEVEIEAGSDAGEGA